MNISFINELSESKLLSAVNIIDGTGVDRQVNIIRIIDEDGYDRVVFDHAGITSLSMSFDPNYAIAYTEYSTAATTNTVTANVVGGTPPYTYAWSVSDYTSAKPPSIGSSTNQTTSFSLSGLISGDSESATVYCLVTDSNGNNVSAELSAFFSHG